MLVTLFIGILCNSLTMWRWYYAIPFLATWTLMGTCLRFCVGFGQRCRDGMLGAVLGAILIHLITLFGRYITTFGEIDREDVTVTQCNDLVSSDHELPSKGTKFYCAHYVARDYRRVFVRCTIRNKDAVDFLRNRERAAQCLYEIVPAANAPPFQKAPDWWPFILALPDLHLQRLGTSPQHTAGECWFYVNETGLLFGYLYAGEWHPH